MEQIYSILSILIGSGLLYFGLKWYGTTLAISFIVEHHHLIVQVYVKYTANLGMIYLKRMQSVCLSACLCLSIYLSLSVSASVAVSLVD